MTISSPKSCCLLTLAAAFAWTPLLGANPPDPNRYMTVDQIKPGMKGFGKSVFQGTEIATFQAEVISVVKNFNPKLDVVLIRLSGQNLEHSGVIGGMSGSPIYINTENATPKLIGAVAYGWYYNKDPICGVQPIAQMLQVSDDTTRRQTKQNADSKKLHQAAVARITTGQGRFAAAGMIPNPPSSPRRDWDSDTELKPLATPIMVSGVSDAALALMKQCLEPLNLAPIAAGTASQNPQQTAKIEPGSALSVPMVTGDLSMAAFGTCTEVVGQQVFGFGHSFTQKGPVEFPMASGIVHTVIPSIRRSFKLGSPLNIQGAIIGDQSAAILGQTNKTASMIPFNVDVDETDAKQSYRYHCINDEFFTPMLASMVLASSITSRTDLPAEHTVRYRIDANFGKYGTFTSSNIASQSGISWAWEDMAVPLMALMDNSFGRFRLESIKATATIENHARLARLEQATLADSLVKPGDTLNIRARWRHYRKPDSVAHYKIQLPENLKEDAYRLTLTSALGRLRDLRNEKPHLFQPDNQTQLVDSFNRIGSFQQNVLYLTFTAQEGGVAVEKQELPDLPDHRRLVLEQASRRETNPYTESIVKTYTLPFVIQGQAQLQFRVSERANQ